MTDQTTTPFHQGRKPNPATTGDGERPASLDDVYALLQNRHCRYVLEYLAETEGSASLAELARQITARETRTEPHAVPPGEHERVQMQLYQCVLPKMDEYDAVTYNRSRGLVEPGPFAECFRAFLPSEVASTPTP
jgi:hypothetical protein